MNRDANVVFQVELADDATIGVAGYLVLMQETVELAIKEYPVFAGEKLSPVVLPQSDGQPADFPLFMLTSELISVQVTKRMVTFTLNYKASGVPIKTVIELMAVFAKELRRRLDEKVQKDYARFDMSFYRFLELKNDEAKVGRANDFVRKVLNLETESEPVDAIQGFQAAYLTKHNEKVSKKIFYAFAINNELKMHAIQLGVGAITGNVGGHDLLTFEKLTLEDAHIDAFIEYIENDIVEVIDERVKSVSECIQ